MFHRWLALLRNKGTRRLMLFLMLTSGMLANGAADEDDEQIKHDGPPPVGTGFDSPSAA
jgi:hypothetical protein